MADADLLHAIDDHLAAVDLNEERTLMLGAARAGNLLEVVVLLGEDEDEPIAIHAMAMRSQFQAWLPEPTDPRRGAP